jgi:sterol desaturase/sphingolipid hydroxylase (fatty acid hydroxylase superfamily)
MEPAQILIYDYTSWPLWFGASYFAVIMLGLQILALIVPFLFGAAEKIPEKGKHLDTLEPIDRTYITINKCLTAMFVYHVIAACYYNDSIKLRSDEVTLANTVGSLVAFYAFYDFMYMWFHRILHIRSLYGAIHKHHHRQKAPSRGNIDAINVHPFEFVVGEYLHLLTVWLIPCHVYTVALFILAGGIFASLNHTRFDVNIPGFYSVKVRLLILSFSSSPSPHPFSSLLFTSLLFSSLLFSSLLFSSLLFSSLLFSSLLFALMAQVHDVHHRLPESNYAQYTMFWDKLHGSYRDYAKVK